MGVNDFLQSVTFQVVGIPLVSVMTGAFARKLARRDNDAAPWWERFAVSTSTLLMAFGIILADLRVAPDGEQRFNSIGWLAAMLLFLFGFIDHERSRSWQVRQDGSAIRRPLVGVLFPDLLALLLFAAYQAQKVGVSI